MEEKNIMLACDTVAAAGSAAILFLLLSGNLQLWQLYFINFGIGLMNAFQQPASMVAVSILTPKKYYEKVSGMQAFSSSAVSILQPALATAAVAFGGLPFVLVVDLASFLIAFLTLAFFIQIEEPPKQDSANGRFWERTAQGVLYLRENKAIWKMILFFAVVNLLASMAGNSLLPAMILSRTQNNQKILGAVTACLGAGTMAGGLFTVVMKMPASKRKTIFVSCGLSFLICDVVWAVGTSPLLWAAAALLGNLPLPLMNAAMSSVMRRKIPIGMQGRAFSAQATFQFFTIPCGYLLGGILADYCFEPFMANPSPLQQFLSALVGTGKGSGMAVIFLLTGILGFTMNLFALRDKDFYELDKGETS